MSILDSNFKHLDTHDMYHKIIHMPQQVNFAYFNSSLLIPENWQKPATKKINRVVFAGMGGSGISGDFASKILFGQISTEVVKDYNLPYVDEKTLVIVISYSGNTAETLSILEKASKLTPHIAAVSSGGKLTEILQNKKIIAKVPGGNPPRSAIAYLFFSLLKVLEKYDIIQKNSEIVQKVVGQLASKAAAICLDTPENKNLAKISARQIMGKIPIIYAATPEFEPLALRFKCQINENSKYPCFYNSFPEMNHNEIEGWETNSENFLPIFLTSLTIEEPYKKRLEAFKQLDAIKKTDWLEFYCEGSSLIEQYFSLIYLGDMISFYLGLLNKVNPTSIDYIDYLKGNI